MGRKTNFSRNNRDAMRRWKIVTHHILHTGDA